MLFKRFADIDVFDIELNATTAEEVIAAVKAIAPTFGGINLEDIKAPEAFEIETRLKAELDIPVFHDDQHGTAIISGAALINAAEVVGKKLDDMKVVISGAGASAIATGEFYIRLGIQRDEHPHGRFTRGHLCRTRRRTERMQVAFANYTDARTLDDAIDGADVFLGLSAAGVLKPDMVKNMAERSASSWRWRTPTRKSGPKTRWRCGPMRSSAPAAAIIPTRSTTCWASPSCSGARWMCMPPADQRRNEDGGGAGAGSSGA